MYRIAISMALALVAAGGPSSALAADSSCSEVNEAKRALSARLSPPEPMARASRSVAGAQQEVQAPRHQQQEVQAPRQQQEVQAPRGQQQEVQAPRHQQQEVQAPRAKDAQSASRATPGTSTPDLAKAQGLITEAEKACTAGKRTEAASKAREALALLR